MNTSINMQAPVARAIARIIPHVYSDEHYFAVNKPPRIDLSAPISRRGPALIDILRNVYEEDRSEDPAEALSSSSIGGGLIPLIVPERQASGIALYAKHEQAANQIAAEAEAGRLAYRHALVVKGAVRGTRINVKPDQIKANKADSKTAPAAEGKSAVKKPLAGRLEVIRSGPSLNIVRCQTHAAALIDLRRIVRAANLAIVGDVEREVQLHPDRVKKHRRLMTHLEAITFEHELGRRTLTLATEPPRSFTEYQSTHHTPQEHLQVALATRLSCLLDQETDCYRLLTAREGISGLSADRYADVIVLEALEGKFHGDVELLRQIANWYNRTLGVETVIAKTIRRRGASDSTDDVEVIRGEPVGEVIVRENGLRLIVTPMSPGLPGLFPDHRDNRRRIRQMSDGADVLNLFAYNCGFSVAAAAGGAKSTTSVDLTVGHLEWGKRNFAANGIDLDNHTFVRSEAFDYFKRARRQKRQFDLIIIDPPTFARSKRPKRTWEIKRDLGHLIAEALTVLRPGGHMLIATNNRLLSANWLIAQFEHAAQQPFRLVARPTLPPDFAPDPAFQKSIIVRLVD